MPTLRRFVLLLGTMAMLALAACAPPKSGFIPVHESAARGLALRLSPGSQNLESWSDLRPGLERSLKFVSVKPVDGTVLSQGDIVLTWGDLRRTITDLLNVLPQLDKDPGLLAERFTWLRMRPQPLLTGYYAPYLEASRERTDEFPYPLYAKPADMFELNLGEFHHRWKGQRLLYRMQDGKPVPYHSRRAIDYAGALEGQGLEIAWVSNQTDVFFLHIQGSGLLRFRDGTVKYALYDGKNGLKYVSLGRVLIERNLLQREGMSMKAIRDFLARNPSMTEELLSTNPSYVFFRLGDKGPYGAMGKLLTPRVSMATDPKLLPLGSVLAFEADLPPDAPGGDTRRVAGIGLAQDTGGAIKKARLDYYCGSGPEVEYFAGHIKNPVTVYLLVSREVLK